MSIKLYTSYNHKKEGKLLNSYRCTFKKTEIEKHNLENKFFNIEYYEDKIVLYVENKKTGN